MTYRDMLAEVNALTIQERLALIEVLTRSVQRDLAAMRPRDEAGARLIETFNARGSALERVLGMAKPDGPPPTDDDVRDLVADYLIEKHS